MYTYYSHNSFTYYSHNVSKERIIYSSIIKAKHAGSLESTVDGLSYFQFLFKYKLQRVWNSNEQFRKKTPTVWDIKSQIQNPLRRSPVLKPFVTSCLRLQCVTKNLDSYYHQIKRRVNQLFSTKL